MLSRVVLPAPFGPMRPNRPPSATSKLTSLTAASPAKFFERRSSLSMGANAGPRFHEAEQLIDQSKHSARLKQNNQNQQASVKQKVKLRKRSNQLLLNQTVYDGADHRAPDSSYPSNDGHQQYRNTDVKSKNTVRMNERRVSGINAARCGCQSGGERVSHQLRCVGIHSEIGSGVLIFANRNQRQTELRVSDPHRNGHGAGGKAQRHIEMQMLIEGAFFGDAVTARATRHSQICHHHTDGFAHANSRYGEVRPSQPKCGQAYQERNDRAHERCQCQGGYAVQSRIERDRRGVSTETVKHRKAERDLACEATQNIPRNAGSDPHQRDKQQPNRVRPRANQWNQC